MPLFKRKLRASDALNIIPAYAIANAATGGSEARKTRRAARQERIRKRQAAKTARMEQRQAKRAQRAEKRQDARAARQEQRQEARMQRQAVRQQARLGKLAERKKLSEQLENLGSVAEGQKAAAAVRNATTNAKMKAYIENQGEQISEDAEPEEIAAQAQELREEEIQDTQDTLNEGLEEGDEPYTQDEAEAFLYDMYDADSFDGDDVNNFDYYTAAVVRSASKSGVARRINKNKRKAKKIRLSDVHPKDIRSILGSSAHKSVIQKQGLAERSLQSAKQMMDNQPRMMKRNGFDDGFDDFDSVEFDGNDFDSENFDLYDVETFDPITMAAIGKASKKGLELIAQKRAKEGKKTFGMTPEKLQELLTAKPSGAATTPVGKVLEAGTEEYKSQKISQESPNIMIIIAVLVIVGIYIGMSKK